MDIEQNPLVQDVLTFLSTYGLDVVGGIAILVIGYVLARLARRLTYGWLGRAKRLDETVRRLIAGLVKYAILAVTLIAVLSNFGIEVTSLIAVFGAAGLAIGLALQGVLSNVAAGVMILMFRPFKLGDFIEATGHSGTVKSINLTTVELATPDNVQILLPNGAVWGAAIKNYSFHPTRRVDLAIGIGYDDDIDKARSAIQSIIDGDTRALRDPEPMIVVTTLGDSAVEITARVWCNASDYWPLRFDLTKTLKERLDREGITIPYPQRTVHMVADTARPDAA